MLRPCPFPPSPPIPPHSYTCTKYNTPLHPVQILCDSVCASVCASVQFLSPKRIAPASACVPSLFLVPTHPSFTRSHTPPQSLQVTPHDQTTQGKIPALDSISDLSFPPVAWHRCIAASWGLSQKRRSRLRLEREGRGAIGAFTLW